MKKPEEVSIEYNSFYIRNKKIHLVFNIYTKSKNDISKYLTKLMSNYDKKFLILEKNNNKTAVFIFDDEKWLKTKSAISSTEDRYKKRIKFDKLPDAILNNISYVNYTSYIEGIFRNYLIQQNPKIFNNQKPSHLKIEYDSNSNSVFVSLKPQFRENIMASIMTKPEPKEIKRMGFDESVEAVLKARRIVG